MEWELEELEDSSLEREGQEGTEGTVGPLLTEEPYSRIVLGLSLSLQAPRSLSFSL